MLRPHPACLPREEFLREVETERTRGSGPGGQHRNRTETFLRVRHVPTGFTAQAGERRSQHENLQKALWRLRLDLALNYRRPHLEGQWEHPSEYRPTPLWTARLRGGRIACRRDHRDFPALLAEALDLLHLYEDDLERTGEALRVTRSQLVKFLAIEPRALAALNERRKARGQRPLRT